MMRKGSFVLALLALLSTAAADRLRTRILRGDARPTGRHAAVVGPGRHGPSGNDDRWVTARNGDDGGGGDGGNDGNDNDGDGENELDNPAYRLRGGARFGVMPRLLFLIGNLSYLIKLSAFVTPDMLLLQALSATGSLLGVTYILLQVA